MLIEIFCQKLIVSDVTFDLLRPSETQDFLHPSTMVVNIERYPFSNL